MSVPDLLREALAGIMTRTGRSILTALGTVLGVGALVSTLGLTSTAAAQIGRRFDVLKATEVVIRDARPDPNDPHPFPPDVEARLTRLNGVLAAGLTWRAQDAAAISLRPPAWLEEDQSTTEVLAVSPGALVAMQPSLQDGRLYDAGFDERAERVAVLGIGMAQRLGLSFRASRQTVIFLDDRRFVVLGVVQDVARKPELLLSVAIPPKTALELWGEAGTETAEVLIHTDIGAAQLIGRQAPFALRPRDPDRLLAIAPPDPRTLRQAVESDVDLLFLLLAGVSLAIGAINIANTTLVSVLERVSEIGLRRALGAGRREVAFQFLTESSVLGTAGGIVGTSLGLLVVVGVSTAKQWTAAMDPTILVGAPLLGSLAGLVAGLYPAVKAARIEPVEALRR